MRMQHILTHLPTIIIVENISKISIGLRHVT
jgi:hypothetical protein